MKGKSSKKGAVLALVFFSIAFASGRAFPQDRPESGSHPELFEFHLNPDQKTATLHSSGAMLSDLLREFSDQTGVTIVFDPDADSPVTVSMEKVAVRSVLHHLLRKLNSAEIWPVAENSGGKPGVGPSRIYVFPRSKSSPGTRAVVFGRAPATPGAVSSANAAVTAVSKRSALRGDGHVTVRPGEEYGYRDKARVTAYLDKKKQAREELRIRESGGVDKEGKANALARYLAKFDESGAKAGRHKPGGAE